MKGKKSIAQVLAFCINPVKPGQSRSSMVKSRPKQPHRVQRQRPQTRNRCVTVRHAGPAAAATAPSTSRASPWTTRSPRLPSCTLVLAVGRPAPVRDARRCRAAPQRLHRTPHRAGAAQSGPLAAERASQRTARAAVRPRRARRAHGSACGEGAGPGRGTGAVTRATMNDAMKTLMRKK